MKPLDPRLLHHARAVRTLLAGSVVIGGLAALATIAQAVLLADVLVRAVLSRAALGALTRPLVALAVVVVVRAALAWAAEELARRSAHRMTAQLRRALLVKAIALGPRWSTHQRRGDLAVLATTGVDGLETYASRYLPQLVLASVVPVMVLTWLVTTDLLSAGIVAVTLPLVPVFMALVGWHTQRRTVDRWHALELLSGHFLDVVAGLPTLKVFGRARAQAEAVRRTTGEYRRATMVTLRVAFLSSFVLELVATLSVALVAVSVGLRLVDGSLDLRTGLAVLVLVPEAYLPLRAVGAQFHASTDGLLAAERVFAVLETPEPARGTGTTVPSPAVAAIELRGVRVRYADRDTDALHCPSLVLRPGAVTAVVAPSGAGKTTLLLVLAGLVVPDAGTVRIGGAGVGEAGVGGAGVGGAGVGGVDLADVDPAVWRSGIAYLGQAPRLVSGTVRENLLLGNADAPEARVWDVLRLAAVDGAVRALPDGLDTAVGEGGALLSAGQRQRIALARAFLRDAPLLLLDEPTSALDADTERRVLAGVAEHARSGARAGGRGARTVVVAAHRAAVLDIADQVVDLLAGAAVATRAGATVATSAGATVAGPDVVVPVTRPAVVDESLAVAR